MTTNTIIPDGTPGRLTVKVEPHGGMTVVSAETDEVFATLPSVADASPEQEQRLRSDAVRISMVPVMERELAKMDERLAYLEGRLGAVTAERDALRQAISVMAAQTDALRWVLPVVAAHLPGGGGSDG